MDYNLEALVNPDVESGVAGGKELLAFSDAVIGPDRATLDNARAALAETLGAAAVPAAAAIAATFSKNDRIANGCGIPADPLILKLTKDFREQIGLNDFRSAVNTFKHFPGT
ncbi:MAG: hypothetical protein HOG95_07605 [Rhodospirillaceae bacterium]|nr:hypothetical protein [Rhodospirillaceae bacterium]MBT7268983.1 hypothetical protein [Rhodospirillaceae bacterium]